MKNNTNYFSHDGNAHADWNCLKLKMKHWLEWYWLYREIIERLFNEWWKVLLNEREAIAYQLHLEYEAFEKMFDCMIDIWLLKTDWIEFFWSDSLLKRINKKNEIKQKRIDAWRKWWLKKKASAKQMLSKSEAIKVNKTKLNKSKSKDISKDIVPIEHWNIEINDVIDLIKKSCLEHWVVYSWIGKRERQRAKNLLQWPFQKAIAPFWMTMENFIDNLIMTSTKLKFASKPVSSAEEIFYNRADVINKAKMQSTNNSNKKKVTTTDLSTYID